MGQPKHKQSMMQELVMYWDIAQNAAAEMKEILAVMTPREGTPTDLHEMATDMTNQINQLFDDNEDEVYQPLLEYI